MPITAEELVARARERIREISPSEARERIEAGAVGLDVREPDEVADGHLPDAVHIPRGFLEFKAPKHPALSDASRPIVVYCKAGGRAALAAATLQDLGYTDVVSIRGGFSGWAQAGEAIATPEDDEEE